MPDALVNALQTTLGVDEFIVSERRREGQSRRLGGVNEEYRTEGRELEAHLFVDHERGRGQTRLLVPPGADVRSLIRNAAVRGLSALGPSWRLRPPAAPARLSVSDVAWQRSIADSIDELAAQFTSKMPSSLRVLGGQIDLSRLQTRVVLSNGFDNTYRSTSALVSAQVQARDGLPVRLRIRACQRKDLRWEEHFQEAERRSVAATSATVTESGPCDLLLMAGSHLPLTDDDFGVWTPLVRQCQANLAATGMARYQLGQEILSTPASGDALTLSSDGTVDYGLRSAPFDDHGQAVRRFTLVESGRATGHSVGYRDAARSSHNANGGVRNLVVHSGPTAMEQLQRPDARPLLIVHALSDLYTEDRGALCLRIESAEWRHLDAAGALVSRPVRGGVLSGSIYDWLSRARFSRERENLLWYDGPKAIRFDKVRVHA